MKSPNALTFAAALMLIGSQPAFAHGSMVPQHGGAVQMSGEIMVELVIKPKGLEIYISEEDEPLPSSSFDGSLIIRKADGTKDSVVLVAAGGNKFTAAARPPKASKVIVSLTDKSSAAKTFVSFRMN